MLAAEIKPSDGNAAWPNPAQAGTVPWQEIAAPFAPFLAEVRDFLEQQVETFEDEVAEQARYALSSSGKHLRPLLVAISAKATGDLLPAHVVGAAIVELVHLATLVHDDIIDAADIRRKKPTVAARYGNATAVLLGDCLFAHSLKLAAGFPTPEICRVVSAATKAVCTGEILQTLRKGRLDQPLPDYFRVIQLKTAELFALACELGALLSATTQARRVALRRFGLAFGIAYQVFDDCLDVFGTEATAGKTLGTDLATGKVTLPFLLAYQHASPNDRSRLESVFHSGASPETSGLEPLFERYAIGSRSRAVVEEHLQEARLSLDPLDHGPDSAPLRSLTQYLAGQVQRLATP